MLLDYEPADEMAEANDAAQPAEAAAAQNYAAADAALCQIKMDLYAPPVFEGRSTDDALSFLQYVERYAAFMARWRETSVYRHPLARYC